MNISIFDVIGPIMVGPSSSHTAGAARLAKIANDICYKPFYKVTFGLHGSFAETGLGHGTDKALLAGTLGFLADDERLKDAYEYARLQGIKYEFYETDLGDVHENTCLITFYNTDGTKSEVQGSSIGGGRILITKLDGADTERTAEQPTIVIRQQDKRGVINSVTQLLAWQGINIAVMRLSRDDKGGTATTVIETDEVFPEHIKPLLEQLDGVNEVRLIYVDDEE